jgi:hypothetical protein
MKLRMGASPAPRGPHLQASTTKLANRAIYPHKSPKSQILYAATSDQLRLKVARGRQSVARRPSYYLDAQNISLESLLREWLEEDVRANNRQATYKLRESSCRNHIIPHLGDVKLADLTPAHVRGLLLNLRSLRLVLVRNRSCMQPFVRYSGSPCATNYWNETSRRSWIDRKLRDRRSVFSM